MEWSVVGKGGQSSISQVLGENSPHDEGVYSTARRPRHTDYCPWEEGRKYPAHL